MKCQFFLIIRINSKIICSLFISAHSARLFIHFDFINWKILLTILFRLFYRHYSNIYIKKSTQVLRAVPIVIVLMESVIMLMMIANDEKRNYFATPMTMRTAKTKKLICVSTCSAKICIQSSTHKKWSADQSVEWIANNSANCGGGGKYMQINSLDSSMTVHQIYISGWFNFAIRFCMCVCSSSNLEVPIPHCLELIIFRLISIK